MASTSQIVGRFNLTKTLPRPLEFLHDAPKSALADGLVQRFAWDHGFMRSIGQDRPVPRLGLRYGAAVLLEGTGFWTRLSFFSLGAVFVVIGILDLFSVVLVGVATSVLLASVTSHSSNSSEHMVEHLGAVLPPWAWLGIAMAVILGKNVLSLIVQRNVEYFMRHREAAVAERTFASLLSTPSPLLQSVEGVRLSNGVAWWAEGLTGGVLGQLIGLSEVLLALVLLVGLSWLNPLTCLAVAAVLVPTIVITSQVISKRTRQSASALRESYAEVLAGVSDGVTLQRESRLYGLGPWLQKRFATRYSSVIVHGTRSAVIARLPMSLLEPATLLGLAVAAGVSFATRPPAVASGELVIFALALSKVIAGLTRAQSQFVMSHRMFGEATVAAPLVAAIIPQGTVDSEVLLHDAESASHYSGAPRLVMEAVEYSYPDHNDYHFGPVTLDLPGGSRVAIVGSTGAGKTTLVDLATGLLRPTAGSVRWLTHDGREVKPSYGYVPQVSTLVRGTLLENVLLDRISKPGGVESARSALSQAKAMGIVNASPEGLSRLVGDRGEGLSGGERQRVSLSRALARGPNVLILDEATSALDAKTESLVTETVRSLAGQATVLVIAHRLSTISDADLVVILSGGRVVDIGNFEDLVQRNGEFEEQARLQGITVGKPDDDGVSVL